jgi:hypothetical protein
MTQDLIANMLGVRREGVTDAAGKLQKLGVIHDSRGQIVVLYRARLEALSCECYAVVERESNRLMQHVQRSISHAAMHSQLVRDAEAGTGSR